MGEGLYLPPTPAKKKKENAHRSRNRVRPPGEENPFSKPVRVKGRPTVKAILELLMEMPNEKVANLKQTDITREHNLSSRAVWSAWKELQRRRVLTIVVTPEGRRITLINRKMLDEVYEEVKSATTPAVYRHRNHSRRASAPRPTAVTE